ncbi:MAG: NUDIX domain-containing protein [Bryobacteraceae bacterium]
MKESAGLLVHRDRDGEIEVLLVHPGGPYFAKKDDGAWSIPKGEFVAPEDPGAAARREFTEETGWCASAPLTPLGTIRMRSGKTVHAFAMAGDFDPATARSNTFEIEWPPRSGKRRAFPEIDRAAWFPLVEARRKINAAQAPLLDRLIGSEGAAVTRADC